MSRPVVVICYWLSFFSGVAALIYEVAWSRMLALTFGSTTLAVAAVVAGFMGGMGIGAWLYHVLYERIARPMLLYGLIELGIALTTALLTLSFYALPDLFAELSHAVPSGPWLTLVRFVSVFVLLLVPSALIGATFPALCTVLIHSAPGVDRHLGMIYGINTIGAAAGVLFAGLFLIERFGLHASTYVANGINVVVGCVAIFLLSQVSRPGRLASAAPVEETAIPTELPRRLTGIVLFSSGFATLAYEILWFRALHYFVGNATYAVTTVLVIFLAGLGLGSLLLRRVALRKAPERDLALTQFAIAVLALGAMACYWLLLSWPTAREYLTIFSEQVRWRPWWFRLIVAGGVSVITMLPATLFMGLSFPLASRLYLGDVRRLSSRVGGAYLLANLGSILGVAVGAMVLLPLFGTVGGTKCAAALNIVMGGLVLLSISKQARGWRIPAVASIAFVAVMAFVLPSSLSLHGEPLTLDEPGRVVFLEEGDLATVQVLEDPHDPGRRAMAIDGCKIGWSRGFAGTQVYRKQVLLAHLPMTIDTRIRRTLNIGLGSAATLQALSTYPDIEQLDCVEISSAVVDAAQFFPEAAVLDDPRVHVIVDDAVHYLLRSDQQYDLIISDGKQHPFFSGNATLLCREFYQYSLNRLTEAGMFIQWVPMSMLHSDFSINLRTMCDVFPHVELFFYPKWAVFMIGSREPLSPRPHLSIEQYGALPISEEMRQYAINSPEEMLSHWAAGREQILAVLAEGPVSTWDHMRLDFTAYKAPPGEWARAKPDNMALLIAAEDVLRTDSAGATMFGLMRSPYRRSARLVRQSFAAYYEENLLDARAFASEAVAVNPDDQTARMTLDFMRSQ